MIKKDWIKNFTDIIELIDKALTAVDEPDNNWRYRIKWIFF